MRFALHCYQRPVVSVDAKNWRLRLLPSKLMRRTAGKCSRSLGLWKLFVLRGDVYRFRLPKGVGHEQHGDRFAVIVQANEFLPRSVVIVAPTSRSARPASFRPEVDVAGERTRVLVEQIGAVDAQRLGDLVGHVTPEEQWGIDEALATVLGLD